MLRKKGSEPDRDEADGAKEHVKNPNTYCGVDKATCGLHLQVTSLVLMMVLVGGILFIAVEVGKKAGVLLDSGISTMSDVNQMTTDFRANRYAAMMKGAQDTLETTSSPTVRNATIETLRLLSTVNSNVTDIQGTVDNVRKLVNHFDLVMLMINGQGGLFGDIGVKFSLPLTFSTSNSDTHDTDDHTSKMGNGLCWTNKKAKEIILELRENLARLEKRKAHCNRNITRELKAYGSATTQVERARITNEVKKWKEQLRLAEKSEKLASGAVATHSDLNSLTQMGQIAEKSNGLLTHTAGLGNRHVKSAVSETRALNAKMGTITDVVGDANHEISAELEDTAKEREANSIASSDGESSAESDDVFIREMMKAYGASMSRSDDEHVIAVRAGGDTSSENPSESEKETLRLLTDMPKPPIALTDNTLPKPYRAARVEDVGLALS